MKINISKNTSSAAAAVPLLAIATAILLSTTVNAASFDVSPDGSPYSIASALAEAGPGDTLHLADGTYDEPIVTVAGGEEGSPLLIEGGRGAVIQGSYGDKHRAVYVSHSWVTIQGFTVDGLVGSAGEESSYIDKCVWVENEGSPTTQRYEGSEVRSSLIGFVMRGMNIKNCGGECVRLRNFVTNAELSDNVIEYCGVYDYRFGDGEEKNGEAIYVGTSSTQWTGGPDGTNYNIISGNTIRPYGNECVDVKEGATGNIIEDNDCSEQLDPKSGCFGARGSGNVFRNNLGADCVGAGIRLGGWEVDGVAYGQDNEVYGNAFKTTGNGAIAARVAPQGLICGNDCDGSSCEIVGEEGVETIVETWDKSCGSVPETPVASDDSVTSSTQQEPTVSTPSEGDNDSTSPSPQESTSTSEESDDDDATTSFSPDEPASTMGEENGGVTDDADEDADDQGEGDDDDDTRSSAQEEFSSREVDDDSDDSGDTFTPPSPQGSSTAAEEEGSTPSQEEDDDSDDVFTTPSPQEEVDDDSDDSGDAWSAPSPQRSSTAAEEEESTSPEEEDDGSDDSGDVFTTPSPQDSEEDGDDGISSFTTDPIPREPDEDDDSNDESENDSGRRGGGGASEAGRGN